MKIKRYAEGTTVPVGNSRTEISRILASHGCQTMAWGTEPQGDMLQFTLGGKSYRFTIPQPTLDELKARTRAEGGIYWKVTDRQVQAEWRRRWRAHVLLIKAKLEFIDGGDTTLEREFLPYAVLRDGRTVGDLMAGGGLPLLTAGDVR